jgi:hypothetical protein
MNNLIRCSVSTVFCALVALAFAPAAFAQVKIQSQPALDVTFSVSSLGWGVQAARPLPHRSDVRGGFNFYTYNTTITEDGADYTTDVRLRSVNVQFDKYLLAGFFASGGALVWNGNNGDAKVSVPGGQSFSLGNVTYFSDAANPVHGDSTVTVQKFAPLLSLGYGNLTSRGHFAYKLEWPFMERLMQLCPWREVPAKTSRPHPHSAEGSCARTLPRIQEFRTTSPRSSKR